METVPLVLAILAVLLAISAQTEAIKCYECTSSYKDKGGKCDDPIDDSLEAVDCEKHYSTLYNVHQNFTMCRKMHQNVEGSARIIRSCATHGLDKCIDRTGTHKIKMKYCECYGDECNAASGIYYQTSLLLAALAFFFSLRT